MVADEAPASQSPKPKRRLRAAPETMRARAEQSAAASKKPRRLHSVKRVLGAPFRAFGRLLHKLDQYKPIHVIGLVLMPRYFRNSWHELRQVAWPSRKESRQLTTAVMFFAIIFGVMIAIVDYGLDKVFKKVILKQ